jgi:hypothetical protein
VIRSTDKVKVPLVALEAQDYFGHHPFLDMGQEPYSASVVGTEDFEVTELDIGKLRDEYEQLSATVKHIIENTGTSISVTTMVVSDLHKNKK